MGYATNVVPV